MHALGAILGCEAMRDVAGAVHCTHPVTGARVAARGSRERESASTRLLKPRDRHTGCKVTTRRAAHAKRVSPSQEGSRPGTPNIRKAPRGCSACRGKGRSRPSAHLTLVELGKPHGVSCLWFPPHADQPGRVPDKKGFIPQEVEEPRRSESWPVMGQIGPLLEHQRKYPARKGADFVVRYHGPIRTVALRQLCTRR